MVKKFVALGFSVVLLVCSLFIGNDGEAVVAGKGNGKNAEVKTVSQLSDVLNTFAQGGSFGIEGMSADVDGAPSVKPMELSTQAGAGATYTSATLYFETQAKASVSANGVRSEVSMEREMVMYCTPTSVYYDMQADIRQSVSGTGDEATDSDSWMIMDVELYMDQTRSVLRFNDLQITTSAEVETDYSDLYAMCNKWLDLTTVDDAADMFLEVNENNYQTMALFGQYVDVFKNSGFSGGNDKYELNKQGALQLCGELADILGVGGVADWFKDPSFEVDLSNAQAPCMTLVYGLDGETEMSVMGSTYSMSQSAAERTVCKVENINNTVVQFPTRAQIYDFAKLSAELGA